MQHVFGTAQSTTRDAFLDKPRSSSPALATETLLNGGMESSLSTMVAATMSDKVDPMKQQQHNNNDLSPPPNGESAGSSPAAVVDLAPDADTTEKTTSFMTIATAVATDSEPTGTSNSQNASAVARQVASRVDDDSNSGHAASLATPVVASSTALEWLNPNEFTIAGYPVSYGGIPTPVAGCRRPFTKFCEHSQAVYKHDADVNTSQEDATSSTTGGGKWPIPLGAYHAFYSFLCSDPMTMVDGILHHQLQIASPKRECQEEGYSMPLKLVKRGMPRQFAKALAPFQCGGVDLYSTRRDAPSWRMTWDSARYMLVGEPLLLHTFSWHSLSHL